MTYPNLDAGSGGSTEPVAVGAEAQGVDDVSSVQGVEVLPSFKSHSMAWPSWEGRRRTQEQTPALVTRPREAFFPPRPWLSWSTLPQASTDTEKLKEAAGKFKEKASRAEIKRVKGGPWSWVSIFVVVFPPCLTSGTGKSGQIFGLLRPHSSHDQDVEPVLGVGDTEMSQNCW